MQRRGGSFFGRRKGKALRPGQRKALETALPALLLDLSAPPPEDLRALFPVPVDDVFLEIGFGAGEHLITEAVRHPRSGFIGVEPFVGGMAKAVVAIELDQLRNIRLYDQDAVVLLDWLPDGSIHRIDLLFPDPWPKKRHWKRRFVNADNLDRIARCLTPRRDVPFRHRCRKLRRMDAGARRGGAQPRLARRSHRQARTVQGLAGHPL
jgi:tRNA (guanine-N7-)-methyltransferase